MAWPTSIVRKIRDLAGANIKEAARQNDPVFTDANAFIHEIRSNCLRLLDAPVEHVLHVGGAGVWYFEWFAKNYAGKINKQTGIDLCPRPDGLPEAITWYQQDGSDLSNFPLESFDMVFAGQFIEHIDCDQQARFLTAANRVLKKGGLLVIDSPNYALANKYGWRHPEHISEFTYEQADVLAVLSGFDVVKAIGLIPERLLPAVRADNNSRYVKPIDMNTLDMDITSALDDNLSNCFIWWLVCKKNGTDVDASLIASVCNRFYAHNKARETIRVYSLIGRLSESEPVIHAATADGAGYILYGPYIGCKPGTYTAGFVLSCPSIPHVPKPNGTICKIDVVAGASCRVLAEKALCADDLAADGVLTLPFVLEEKAVLQTRVYAYGVADLTANVSIAITPMPPSSLDES